MPRSPRPWSQRFGLRHYRSRQRDSFDVVRGSSTRWRHWPSRRHECSAPGTGWEAGVAGIEELLLIEAVMHWHLAPEVHRNTSHRNTSRRDGGPQKQRHCSKSPQRFGHGWAAKRGSNLKFQVDCLGPFSGGDFSSWVPGIKALAEALRLLQPTPERPTRTSRVLSGGCRHSFGAEGASAYGEMATTGAWLLVEIQASSPGLNRGHYGVLPLHVLPKGDYRPTPGPHADGAGHMALVSAQGRCPRPHPLRVIRDRRVEPLRDGLCRPPGRPLPK